MSSYATGAKRAGRANWIYHSIPAFRNAISASSKTDAVYPVDKPCSMLLRPLMFPFASATPKD